MTQEILKLYEMGRTRLTNQIPAIAETDLVKKLHPESNSIGFLIRHIAEVEHLFAKNVFGLDIHVMLHTVGKEIHDTNKYTNLKEELDFLEEGRKVMQQAISNILDSEWGVSITVAPFGTLTKAEAIGRIVSHTAYHAGQVGLIMKYAK